MAVLDESVAWIAHISAMTDDISDVLRLEQGGVFTPALRRLDLREVCRAAAAEAARKRGDSRLNSQVYTIEHFYVRCFES